MGGSGWVAWIVFGILALLGAIFLSIGIGVTVSRKNKRRKCTAEATGVIVEYRRRRNAFNRASLFPVIEFTADGKNVRVESHFGSTNPEFAPGDSVVVCYDPNDDKRYYIMNSKIGHTLSVEDCWDWVSFCWYFCLFLFHNSILAGKELP